MYEGKLLYFYGVTVILPTNFMYPLCIVYMLSITQRPTRMRKEFY